MYIKSINPSNNTIIKTYKAHTTKEIDEFVKEARKASTSWRKTTLEEKVEIMRSLLDELIKEKEQLARIITEEVGKPLAQSYIELEKGYKYYDYYLKNLKEYIGVKKLYEDDEQIDFITYEPKGVASVIISWNFPFTLFIWQVIPNLLVGNTVLLKHSSSCVNTASYLSNIVLNSKLPKGVFTNIIGSVKECTYLLTKDIDIICFTGGVNTGQYLYKTASKKMINIVLEMGGSNPIIIFDDYPIEKAVKKVVEKRFNNAGQVCNAVKRIIISESIKDRFLGLLIKEVKKLRVGSPFDDTTDIGPLGSKSQLYLLVAQVQDAIKNGAVIKIGGKRIKNIGNFYEPTILTNISKTMRVWKEETFGPVLPIMSFNEEREAIDMANDSDYGMGAIILTKDQSKAQRVANKLECGMIDINDGKSSKQSNPFGGMKKSSLGRVNGEWGFRELTNIKVISKSKLRA